MLTCELLLVLQLVSASVGVTAADIEPLLVQETEVERSGSTASAAAAPEAAADRPEVAAESSEWDLAVSELELADSVEGVHGALGRLLAAVRDGQHPAQRLDGSTEEVPPAAIDLRNKVAPILLAKVCFAGAPPRPANDGSPDCCIGNYRGRSFRRQASGGLAQWPQQVESCCVRAPRLLRRCDHLKAGAYNARCLVRASLSNNNVRSIERSCKGDGSGVVHLLLLSAPSHIRPALLTTARSNRCEYSPPVIM